MKTQYLFFILFVGFLGGAIFIFKDEIFKKDDEEEPPILPPYEDSRVIELAKNYDNWTGRPTEESDWGSIAQQIRSYLGFNPNEIYNGAGDGYGVVFGFLKGHDIGLGTNGIKNGWTIRVFKDYIKDYLQTNARSDYEVTKGEFLT
jgi:hypothetical protein